MNSPTAPISTVFGAKPLSLHPNNPNPPSSYPISDINIDPILNAENFDLAKYFNDLYYRRYGVLLEQYRRRLVEKAQQLAQEQFAAAAAAGIKLGPTPTTAPVSPGKTSTRDLIDRSGCAKLAAGQMFQHLWGFICGTAKIHTFAGLAMFVILSLLNRDILWFILYWLQVPFLGVNGPRIGWLYVPPRSTWENEVNTRRWRCTFYAFTDNNYGWILAGKALLVYAVVYPITYFLVPEEVLYHANIIHLANITFFWRICVSSWLLFWVIHIYGSSLWGLMKGTWNLLCNQRRILFAMIWRKRYLGCLGLVLFLAWWPNRPGLEDPKHVCGTGPENYDPGFFLTFAGFLYTLGDAARSLAASCFL